MQQNDNSPRIWSDIWPVLWPLLLETGLAIFVGVAGTWLAGRSGDASSAAFGLGHHVWGLLFVCFRMVGAGITVAVSHQLGAGHRAEAKKQSAASLGAALAMGLLIAGLAYFFAADILKILQTPASILRESLLFLEWLALCFVLEALCIAMAAVLRAHLFVRTVLSSMVLTHLLHLGLAALWMPQYGLLGFAYALLLSRVLQALGVFILWRICLQGFPIWRDVFLPAWQSLLPVLRIGLPTFIENITWTLAFMWSVRVAAGMGVEALAAHTYVMQIAFMVILLGMAMGMSLEIILGHLIGAGRLKAAYLLGRNALFAGVLLTALLAAFVALLSPWVLSWFTQNPAVIALSLPLIWLGMVVEPGRTLNIMMNDALRAAGDAKFPAQISIPPMILILALGSWLLGDYFGWGLIGVWIAYALDEWLRGLINYARWHYKGWASAAHRLHREKQKLLRQTKSL